VRSPRARRLAATSVVAGLLLVVLPSTSFAHTHVASSVWTHKQNVPLAGGQTIQIKDIGLAVGAWNGTQQLLSWHVRADCNDSGQMTEILRPIPHRLDSSGARVQTLGHTTSYNTNFFLCGGSPAGTEKHYYNDQPINNAYAYEYCIVGATTGTEYGCAKTSSEWEGPEAPDNVEVSARSSGSVTLTWDTVSGATAWETRYRQGSGSWSSVESQNVSILSKVFTGLEPESSYTFAVRTAENGLTSDWVEVTSTTLVGSSCTESQGYEWAVASLISGDFKLYFKWVGSAGSGWDVYVPDPGDPPYGTADAFVPVEQIAGTHGVYGVEVDASGLSGGDLRLVRRGSGCYLSVPVSASEEASPAGPSDGSGSDDSATDESGAGCGWNPLTNLFCWIKAALMWAFVPGDATFNAWDELRTNLSTKPPFSVAVGGVGFVLTFWEDLLFRFEGETTGDQLCFDVDPSGVLEQTEDACLLASMQQIAEHELMQVLRFLSSILIIVGVLFAIQRVLKSGFSDAPEPKGAEIASDESERKDED
jgi:hypothetical protein